MGSRSIGARILVVVGLLAIAAVPPAQARSGRPEYTKASWYGHGFHGRRTASGARFDSNRLTAAHRTLRLGSKVRVTDLRSGRSVVVQINDRGPFVAGRGIDLSYAAARQLGIVDRGVARVKIERIDRIEVPRSKRPSSPISIASAQTDTAGWWPRALVR